MLHLETAATLPLLAHTLTAFDLIEHRKGRVNGFGRDVSEERGKHGRREGDDRRRKVTTVGEVVLKSVKLCSDDGHDEEKAEALIWRSRRMGRREPWWDYFGVADVRRKGRCWQGYPASFAASQLLLLNTLTCPRLLLALLNVIILPLLVTFIIPPLLLHLARPHVLQQVDCSLGPLKRVGLVRAQVLLPTSLVDLNDAANLVESGHDPAGPRSCLSKGAARLKGAVLNLHSSLNAVLDGLDVGGSFEVAGIESGATEEVLLASPKRDLLQRGVRKGVSALGCRVIGPFSVKLATMLALTGITSPGCCLSSSSVISLAGLTLTSMALTLLRSSSILLCSEVAAEDVACIAGRLVLAEEEVAAEPCRCCFCWAARSLEGMVFVGR